ncbi:TetR/AcrR family transcriptional regulator [Klebsiella pneumoniae]|uniref:TetR/AcrR family transcriptional regulator n=2 Tax=Klebsiella pneumoniae TaxID=573 RepID=UPI001401CDDD|nr:TetR/AcrR family transcriptional regulator [Klebsiella pneumoniae]
MTTMTRERLLSEAEHLMREKGYSVFSYADLSKIVGITKASIHHHFPTKDILGEQVVIQAFSDTQRVFEQIEATEKSAERRIAAYIDIFAQSHKASLLPLCCALSAETANLPQAITVQTSLYFDMQIEWLTKGHCCKVSDEAAFCLIQRPYISKTLLTRRISPRGSP